MDLGKITIIGKIRGGSNCKVYKCLGLVSNDLKPFVIKILDCSEKITILKNIQKDYEKIRFKVVSEEVPVPELLFDEIYKNSDLPTMLRGEKILCFIIVESYEGLSIRDLICDSNTSNAEKFQIIKKCESFINTFPENIPMDTNPGNILYNIQNKSFYFIDFLPPNPWEYGRESTLYESYIKVFPTIPLTLSDPDNWNRYHKNKSRIERFYYHLKRHGLQDL